MNSCLALKALRSLHKKAKLLCKKTRPNQTDVGSMRGASFTRADQRFPKNSLKFTCRIGPHCWHHKWNTTWRWGPSPQWKPWRPSRRRASAPTHLKKTCHAAAFSSKVKFDVSRAGGTWKGSLNPIGIVRKRRLCTAGRIVAINKK